MKGYVDRVEGNRVIGWCAPAVLGSPATILARLGSYEIATACADIERLDVEAAGVCEACCGFELVVSLQAFDRHGLDFPITLERVEDGMVFAETVSIDSRGDGWIWLPGDLASIVKKWRDEMSSTEREKVRRSLSRFDLSDLVDSMMEHGFFGELDAAIAAKADPVNGPQSWITFSGEACSNTQIKRWAFECRLKAAIARARTALLKAEFLDGSVMPVFREALAGDMVTSSDWVALIDLFALCPTATSLGEFFQGLIEILVAKHPGVDRIIEACLHHGQIELIEMASSEAATRISKGEIVPALCCFALDCSAQSNVTNKFNLDSFFSSIENAANYLPEQHEADVDDAWVSGDSHVWPSHNGLRWPQFVMPESKVSAQLTLLLFVTDSALPEACHDSVLSILNQALQDFRILIIGNVDRLSAKTYERLENEEAYFFSGDSENNDLLREVSGRIAGDYVGWLEAGEIVGPGVLGSISSAADQNRTELDPSVIIFDTANFTVARIGAHRSAAHLGKLSNDSLSRIEENWLDDQFLSDGWLLIAPDTFLDGLNLFPALAGIDALQYAVCYAFASHKGVVKHSEMIGLYRSLPLQPVEPLHTREIIQQAKQRSSIVGEPPTSPEAMKRCKALLSQYFASGSRRITIMSTRLGKIFSSDAPREILEHFSRLGYQVELVDEINLERIVPGQLILVLVHQYGIEEELIPVIAKRFPDCPLIGWFWDNHHQALGNVEFARHFHGCIAAHDFCRDILVSQRNVLLPSVPLCVTQWTAAEAKILFAKYGQGERSKSLYGGFVRYATAARRNEFVTALQKHLDHHALSLVDEFNLAAYFALPAEERFSDWCHYRTSLCIPLFRDLSQRFFDALLCGQFPIVTEDIADMDQIVHSHPELVKRFEILKGYDINGLDSVLEDASRRLGIDHRITPAEQHNYALNHHMFQNRIETILSSLKVFAKPSLVEVPSDIS